jgi:hypothetical protein
MQDNFWEKAIKTIKRFDFIFWRCNLWMFICNFLPIYLLFYMQMLSSESSAILALHVSEIELALENERIAFPMGKSFQKKYRVSNEQVKKLFNEIREKILFPSTR